MTFDSDSDDDDLLPLQAFGGASKRKRNQTDKKRTNKFSLLDEALSHFDARKEADDKVALLQKQQPKGEDHFMAEVEETIATAKEAQSKPAVKRDAATMGMVEDLENVLGQQRRRELGKARDEDLSSKLGARNIVSFAPKKLADGKTTFFDAKSLTYAIYIRQLKEILRKLVSPKNRILQSAWIQPLRQAVRNGTDFRYFLEHRMLCQLRQEHDLVDVPDEILLWFLRLACSPDTGDSDLTLRYGALSTLKGILRQNKALGVQSKIFSLSNLAAQLESWVPLASDKKETKNCNDNDKERQEEKQEKKTKEEAISNARGLEFLFSLWDTAFISDQVSVSYAGADDAKRCLVLLAKLALDISFHSTEINHGLQKHLKCLICQILQIVEQILVKEGEKNALEEWIDETASAIITELKDSKLGPGNDYAEDSDDHNAWLCYALLCRVWPHLRRTHSHKTDCQFQQAVVDFKAVLCLRTLQHFFGIASDKWDEETFISLDNFQTTEKCDYNLLKNAKSSRRWLVLCSSFVSLLRVKLLLKEGEADKAKILAILEVALGQCLTVGMELFKALDVEDSEESDTPAMTVNNQYKSKQGARDIARLLGLMKIQCNGLPRGMNAMASHDRRAAYFVQCQNKYLTEAEEQAARLGGDRKVLQQQGIAQFLTKVKAESDDEEDEEDEEEDSDDDDLENSTKKQRTEGVGK